MNVAAKHFVYVDSRNRLSGTDGNFTYLVNLPADEVYTHVVVLNALIPKSYYLVPVTAQIITLVEKGVNTVVTIPAGDYILSAWLLQVSTSLTAASPNTWTYKATFPNIGTTVNTGKITITVTGNGGFQPALICSTTFFEQWGFNKGSTNTFVANTLVSTNVVKLQAEDRVFLLTDMIKGTNSMCVLLSIASAPSPDFSSIQYECFAPEYYAKELRSSNINVISIAQSDESGNLLFPNGLNMTCTLLFLRFSNIYDIVDAYIKTKSITHHNTEKPNQSQIFDNNTEQPANNQGQ